MSHASLPARLERGSCTRCRDCWSRRSASIRRHGQDSRALVWAKWCVLLKDWFGCGGNQVATQARLRELISKVRGAARIVHSLGGGTIPGIKLTDCIGVLMVVCRSGRFTTYRGTSRAPLEASTRRSELPIMRACRTAARKILLLKAEIPTGFRTAQGLRRSRLLPASTK